MSFFRPEIEEMDGYSPGEQPGESKFIKLNTNENPYPPPPGVAAAVAEAVSRLPKYPDALATSFRLAAASVLNVDPEQILCGNGSDDLLTILTRAFVPDGKSLRLPYPSYVLYKTLAQIQGAAADEQGLEPQFAGRQVPTRGQQEAGRLGLGLHALAARAEAQGLVEARGRIAWRAG